MPAKKIDLDAYLAAMGREIRAERTRRAWSRKELAERANLSEKQVGNIERGDRGQLAEAWRIATALGVPFSEIAGRAEQSAASF